MHTTTKFYLSTYNILDAGDTVLGGRTVPALAAGASSTGTTTVPFPAGTTPGTYYIIARADAHGAIAETMRKTIRRLKPSSSGLTLLSLL